MTRTNLTGQQLVELFIKIALEQEEAAFWGKVAKSNKLYRQMKELEEEFRSRPGDQRRLLIPLFEHENSQVVLEAARANLETVPEAARHALEKLASSKRHPQAGDAGMTLWALDKKSFRASLNQIESEQLVQQFLKNAVEQGALSNNQVGRSSELFWEMEAIKDELKARQGDPRRMLIPFLKHENPKVRYCAAKATWALAPAAARHALEEIVNEGDQPLAQDAEMSIFEIDKGIVTPT